MYLAEKNRAVCTHTEFILFLKKGLEVTFGHFVCWKRVIIGVIRHCIYLFTTGKDATIRFVVRMNKGTTDTNSVRVEDLDKPVDLSFAIANNRKYGNRSRTARFSRPDL
jgi:hypothetical protein